MKIGGRIEGTPEEITDFIENNGLKLEDILQKPRPRVKARWIGISVFLFILSLGALVIIGSVPTKLFTCLVIMGVGFVVWIAAVIQLRFCNVWATSFTALGLILMLSMAAGLMKPQEALDLYRKHLAQEKSEK